MRYAIIDINTQTVENIIVWDGVCQVINTEKYLPVLLAQGEECLIGYEYNPNESTRFYSTDFNIINL
jgi:hypothetical protein